MAQHPTVTQEVGCVQARAIFAGQILLLTVMHWMGTVGQVDGYRTGYAVKCHVLPQLWATLPLREQPEHQIAVGIWIDQASRPGREG